MKTKAATLKKGMKGGKKAEFPPGDFERGETKKYYSVRTVWKSQSSKIFNANKVEYFTASEYVFFYIYVQTPYRDQHAERLTVRTSCATSQLHLLDASFWSPVQVFFITKHSFLIFFFLFFKQKINVVQTSCSN